MDRLTKKARSENMSRIRNRDTAPEKAVRKYLYSRGLKYRKNDRRYPGKPDVVVPRYKTVVFVNGCFWHYHKGCKDFTIPKTNRDFWEKKLNGNVKRDKSNYLRLINDGWNVITVWECELVMASRKERLEHLYNEIVGNGS